MSQPAKTSLLRRLSRGLLTITLTGAFVTGAGAAILFGSGLLSARAEAVAPPDAAEPTPVSATPLMLEEGYDITRRFVGQIEARQSAGLSFELAGRLVELGVDEGDTVRAGEVLATLDTDLLMAERARLTASRAALAAQLDYAESTVRRSAALSQRGFATEDRLDRSEASRDELTARIAEIDAGLDSVGIRLRKSELTAPFDGRIGRRAADPGVTLAAGQTVLELIETGVPQVRVGLPLSVSADALEDARIVIGTARHDARLIALRPDIDPVTRTRTALFALEGASAPAFGQTATLEITEHVAVPGAWVPARAIQEGTGSLWTVLVVEDGVVRSAAVEVLHAEAARVYVRGTFGPGAMLIDAGPQRVTPGQTVRLIGES